MRLSVRARRVARRLRLGAPRAPRAAAAAASLLSLLLLLLAAAARRRAAARADDGGAAALSWRSEPLQALEHEAWTRVKHDVVIAVKTGHEVARARLRALHTHGWWRVGRHVPNLVVVSDADDAAVGAVGLKAYARRLLAARAAADAAPPHWFDRAGWRGDKDKNLPAVHLMRTLFPDKKWYVLLDDDTYVFLDNLATYLSAAPMSGAAPVYTGKVFYISRCGGFERDGTWAANRSAPKGVFAHGGSGIVMNAPAVAAMHHGVPGCIRDFSDCWAGDMQLSLCLRKHGVLLKRVANTRVGRTSFTGPSGFERHFTPVAPSKALSDRRYSRHWRGVDLPLTFHKMPLDEMHALSDFERLCAASNRSAHYSALRRHLLARAIWPDHSPHAQKSKHYSTEFLPPHLIANASAPRS